MRWWKWQIAAGPGDFLPLVIGCTIMLISFPAFVMLIVYPDKNSAGLDAPFLVIMGAGIALGLSFLVLGVQLLSRPGSLIYRLAHGRLFWH